MESTHHSSHTGPLWNGFIHNPVSSALPLGTLINYPSNHLNKTVLYKEVGKQSELRGKMCPCRGAEGDLWHLSLWGQRERGQEKDWYIVLHSGVFLHSPGRVWEQSSCRVRGQPGQGEQEKELISVWNWRTWGSWRGWTASSELGRRLSNLNL